MTFLLRFVRHSGAAILFATIAVAAGNVSAQTFAYVVDQGDNAISLVDTATNKVVKTITGQGLGPGVTLDALDGKWPLLYVTNQFSNTVTPINTISGRVLPDIVVGNTPVGVAFTPNGRSAYVTVAGNNAVAIIDVLTGAVVASIAVGQSPTRVRFHPDGRSAWVTNQDSASISVINTTTLKVVRTIAVGRTPVELAFNSRRAVGICVQRRR